MSHPSTGMQGNLTSVYNLGCFVGALSTIWIGDRLGRPKTILIGSSIIAVGGLLQATSYSVPQMMAGRIVAGSGTGMNTATAGVWQAETSRMNSRGKLIVIQMANCIFGVVIANFLTLGFAFAPGSVAWRFPLAFQIFWCMCPFLPDSPRLLIRKGRDQEGLEVLAALAGDGASSTSKEVQSQYRIIKDVLEREQASTYKWYTILAGKGPAGLLRRIILGAWMLAMTQLSGINITSYYMTYVFENALHFTTLRSRILSAAGSIVYLVFSLLAYLIIERWGRRTVIIISSLGCAICWIMVAIMQALVVSDPAGSTAYNTVAVVFFFVFWAAFGMGLLPVPWIYPTEINALEKRTVGAALAVCTNWILNYMVAEVTPLGIANLGWRFWVIWAVICASFIPIVYFFYPETANRSLEDIDKFFETKPGMLVHRNQLALQLQRPAMFAEEDARVAQGVEKDGLDGVMEHEERVF
ncbi:uncharacterized protein PFLUO_LOCUS8473 [Penicillium psychrofluorescens]|uniref:uncharacterized protein n=1 Tax=Penicillium psychrofluorescens TaxID=3158075 RepID=UPI003CCCE24F